MNNPAGIITEFVLERLPGESVKKRIKLCRALAAVVSSNEERKELLAIVGDLERVERRQRKLTLRFKGGMD